MQAAPSPERSLIIVKRRRSEATQSDRLNDFDGTDLVFQSQRPGWRLLTPALPRATQGRTVQVIEKRRMHLLCRCSCRADGRDPESFGYYHVGLA
jgi:hypothetical protein